MDKKSNFELRFDNLSIESDIESNDNEDNSHLFDHYFIYNNNSWFVDQTFPPDVGQVEEEFSLDDITFDTTIEALNEYCFINLLSFLSFYDLLSLRSVSTQFKTRVEEFLRSKRKLKLINSFAKQNINIETTETIGSDLTVIANDCQTDHILVSIIKLCPNLEALELIYITIDDTIVEILTKDFYYINDLCFAHPLGLTEDNIQLIVDYFGPQLIGLTVVDSDLSEDCLHSIVTECPNLKSLEVSGNPDITGHCLQYLYKSLLSLRLSQCESFGESGLNAVVRSKAVHNLQELVISGVISDYMIKIIAENMPQLKSFTCVYGCTRELDSNTDHLSVIGLMSGLERLSLQEIDAYFGSLDDKSLLNILKCCNRLTHLELHVGSGERLLVTDRSLSLIANYCPLIECLKIYYFEAITDRSLNSFSKLKHLKELELINLYNISDEGIVIITELCSQLSKLWISFDGSCDSITNLTLIACLEMCRHRPKHLIEVNFFETCITVPFNLIIPLNMQLSVSWYRPTPEGRRYTEIKLPTVKHIYGQTLAI